MTPAARLSFDLSRRHALAGALLAMGAPLAMARTVGSGQLKSEVRAVSGFDGTEHSAYSYPPLTTIRQPLPEMADRVIAEAARSTDDRIRRFYQDTFFRNPTDRELQRSREFLAAQTEAVRLDECRGADQFQLQIAVNALGVRQGIDLIANGFPGFLRV